MNKNYNEECEIKRVISVKKEKYKKIYKSNILLKVAKSNLNS